MSTRASIIAIVSVTMVVEIAMVLTDMGPNILVVGVLCVLAGTSLWVFSELNAAVIRPSPPPAICDLTTRPDTDRRVWVLRHTLLGRHRDRVDDRLYRTLVELIDDQLSAAHNVERHLDPAAAAAILGAELTTFVSSASAPHGLSRPRRINHIVTLIEQI